MRGLIIFELIAASLAAFLFGYGMMMWLGWFAVPINAAVGFMGGRWLGKRHASALYGRRL